MKKLAVLGAVLAGGVFATSSFTGCGTEPDNVFDGGEGSSGTSGTSGASSGACIGCGEGGTSGASGTSGSSGADPFEECGVDRLGGELLPIELTIIFDKSASMCYTGGTPGFDCADATTRWPATSAALRTFLTSPQSAGLTVAVRSFGPVDTFPANTEAGNRCQAANYSTLEAGYGPSDLPSATLADAVLADLPFFPDQQGNATMTQTGPAIAGSLIYTQGRQTALAGAKGVAMLLVSDGDPTGCGGIATGGTQQDIDKAVAAATAAAAAGIKLYVLNIGGTKFNLDAIAAAGGTNEAITINNPTDSSAISAALASIRGQTLSCEFPIPMPSNGLTPNFEELNVTFTPPGGSARVLNQTTDCAANPDGWQYDNPQAPTKIALCPGACETVLSSVTGQINVVLGCSTVVGPVN